MGDPPITASSHTSCAFAGAILTSYYRAASPRTWHGRVLSPTTRRRYVVTCRRFANDGLPYVACFTPNFAAWINFNLD
jgi:hypothetical protein